MAKTSLSAIVTIAPLAVLAACKPPPTDADLARDMPDAPAAFASEPLPSPETAGATWAQSPQNAARLIYGIPGNPALVALECLDEGGASARLQITRLSPADEGAGALLALVGNGAIGRIAVDAADMGGKVVWQGSAGAADIDWEPLGGPRQVTLTVPGAGMVTLNPSDKPWAMLETCRGLPAQSDAPAQTEELAPPP